MIWKWLLSIYSPLEIKLNKFVLTSDFENFSEIVVLIQMVPIMVKYPGSCEPRNNKDNYTDRYFFIIK